MIGLAMKMYAVGETRTNAFPRTVHDRATADFPTAYTNPNAANPFAAGGPLPNDVTAAMFLILRTQEITTGVFLCPEDRNGTPFPIPAGKTIQSFSNFPSQSHLSYGMQNPYPTEAAEKAGFIWADTMSPDTAILADFNPGVPAVTTVTFNASGVDQRKANSPNHDYDGQNVLYADGHVDWSASVWAGAGQDNIYGFNAPSTTIPASQPTLNTPATTTPATTNPTNPPEQPVGIVGPPDGPDDSVILPAWDLKIPRP
jgi:prepilin-type processing-associated H-X9-DG protein